MKTKIRLEPYLFIERMPYGIFALTCEVDGQTTDLIYLTDALIAKLQEAKDAI